MRVLKAAAEALDPSVALGEDGCGAVGQPSHPRAGHRADGGVMPWGRGWEILSNAALALPAHSPVLPEDSGRKLQGGPGFCCSLANRVL